MSFLERCIHWDPSSRLTLAQASKHPWISKSVPRPLTTEKVSGKQVANSANSLQGLGSKRPSVVGIANKLEAD